MKSLLSAPRLALRGTFEIQKALNYASEFFRVVVVQCLRPSHWRYCFPPTWIVPYLSDLRDYYTTVPYAKEREYLLEAD
jgi:hypothetical protein